MSGYEFPRRQTRGDRNRNWLAIDGEPTIGDVGDPENLIAAYRELKQRGGQSPGPDQLRYDELSMSEAANFMRELSVSIIQGTYHPQPHRIAPVPKAGGQGTRTLRIGNIRDRVVAASINYVLTPFWEDVFFDCSFGFRQRHSAFGMLASLELKMKSMERWVLAIDDVRNAFDNVPLDRVMALHKKSLADRRLLDLIREQLQTMPADSQHAGVGIPQGSAYSPTALNVLLHYHLDAKLAKRRLGPDYFRYADNLVFACRTISEGQRALEMTGKLLAPLGMQLKGEDGVVDLAAGEEGQLLGFSVGKRGDKLSLRLGQHAVEELHLRLKEAHKETAPQKSARYALLGWIDAHGIALKASQLGVEALLRIAADHGFREIGAAGELEARRKASCSRWAEARQRARGRHKKLGRA